MLRSELLEIIANGESSGIEFKRDDVRPEQLAKEIVALANLQGGRVLVGVEDDGTISGIQRDDLETWIMDTVSGRYVHPQILPFYEEILVEGSKRVAVISIGPGISKPYLVRHHGREEIYVRVGSTSRQASREQQARLFALGGLLHAEVMPISGTDLEDLSRDRLGDYLVGILRDSATPQSQEAWERRLEGMGFMASQDGRTVCSMTVEKMLAGQRSPRNPLIVDVMRDFGYVDARGMGVRRKIVPLIREASGQDARFEVTDDFVKVVLPISVPPGERSISVL